MNRRSDSVIEHDNKQDQADVLELKKKHGAAAAQQSHVDEDAHVDIKQKDEARSAPATPAVVPEAVNRRRLPFKIGGATGGTAAAARRVRQRAQQQGCAGATSSRGAAAALPASTSAAEAEAPPSFDAADQEIARGNAGGAGGPTTTTASDDTSADDKKLAPTHLTTTDVFQFCAKWPQRYPLLGAKRQQTITVDAAQSILVQLNRSSVAGGSSSSTATTTAEASNRYIVPPWISSYLKPYQRHGVHWLLKNLVGRDTPIGSLLGDDMGLGKTVQVACLLGAMYLTSNATLLRATIIVAPPSLLDNWREELRRWTPLEVEKFDVRGCARILERVNSGLCNVVLVSSGIFSQDYAANTELRALLLTSWGCVVVDEVHVCKNPATTLSSNIALLRSRRKLGLTGTLVANHVGEVWALLRCVGEQKRHGTKEAFDQRYSHAIQEGLRAGAGAIDLAVRDRAAREFRDCVFRPHILRRTKAEAGLGLPGKRDRILACPLTDLQKRCYKNLLASNDVLAILAGGKSVTLSEVLRKGNLQQQLPIASEADEQARVLPAVDVPEDSSSYFRRCACQIGPQRCACNMGVIWKNMHRKCALEDRPCKSWLHPYKCHWMAVLTWLQKISNHLDLLQTKLPLDVRELSRAEKADRNAELQLCAVVFAGTELGTLVGRLREIEAAEAEQEMDLEEMPRQSTSSNPKNISWHNSTRRSSDEDVRPRSSSLDSASAVVLQLRKISARNCGKLQMLLRLLQLWRDNTAEQNKVLVFSRSTKLLDLIEFAIRSYGIRSLRLDGSTPPKTRQALCQQFNTEAEIFVFLISTRAGGVGLNLTSANMARPDGLVTLTTVATVAFHRSATASIYLSASRHFPTPPPAPHNRTSLTAGVGLNLTMSGLSIANKVVIFDPDWNPCMDLQCQDRAFRIGQARFVEVFRLLAAGTVEEQMYYRQVHKQQVSRLTVDDVKTARRLDAGELDGLERFFRFDDKKIGKTFMNNSTASCIGGAGAAGLTTLTSAHSASASSAAGPPRFDPEDVEQPMSLMQDDERDLEKMEKDGSGVDELNLSGGEINDNVFADDTVAIQDDRDRTNRLAARGPQVTATGTAQAQAPPTTTSSSSDEHEGNILRECQQFLHDDHMKKDSQEEMLAEEAEVLYGNLYGAEDEVMEAIDAVNALGGGAEGARSEDTGMAGPGVGVPQPVREAEAGRQAKRKKPND
eukprot:g9531.t1